ncbi:hypothetical protein BJY00DRAFT_275573 [Aspergillus carlsbadensis]|nr:hypothetical protein BJY00DRAFT_275573 [Aspergillus carlsbadensis]
MLVQIKVFLQGQVHSPPSPFRIVILGYRDSFDSGLDQTVFKLQRDISQLHPENIIHFLDIGSSQDHSPTEIVATIADLAQSQPTSRAAIELAKPSLLSTPRKPKAKIALSCDFDALSAFLGTGAHADNNMADYSTGIFSARVGTRRLLHTLRKYNIAGKSTWFIPGHTMETFPDAVREVVSAGAEIGLHGYAHEGAYQMTVQQERDVLVKCMDVAQRLTGKKVAGYRAPMYQVRESTIELLRELGFLYDSSLSHHDSQPYFCPWNSVPVSAVDFSKPAETWMHPTPVAALDVPPPAGVDAGGRNTAPLVEIPTGWNNEDMMALQYFPHVANTQGFVDARVVEQRWKDMFLWLWENAQLDREDGTFVFPILMHPDTSGMLHVIGMVERFVAWLRNWGQLVEFHTFSDIARDWLKERI